VTSTSKSRFDRIHTQNVLNLEILLDDDFEAQVSGGEDFAEPQLVLGVFKSKSVATNNDETHRVDNGREELLSCDF
jgi:hypothetical protein